MGVCNEDNTLCAGLDIRPASFFNLRSIDERIRVMTISLFPSCQDLHCWDHAIRT